MDQVTLVIGWDVGGWRSRNNVLFPLLTGGGKLLKAGAPVRLPATELPVLAHPDGLLEFLAGQAGCEEVLADYHAQPPAGRSVILGVDSPLGYSEAFRELLQESASGLSDPSGRLPAENLVRPAKPQSRYVDNIYGFRTTERFIGRRLFKQTLSAAFDYLGNNATLSLRVRKNWEGTGFVTPPFGMEAADASRLILEVYPGIFLPPRRKPRGVQAEQRDRTLEWLLRARTAFRSCLSAKQKVGPGRVEAGLNWYLRDKPEALCPGIEPDKTDEADALICALLGAGWECEDFPLEKNWRKLVDEEEVDRIRREGWVFFPAGIISD